MNYLFRDTRRYEVMIIPFLPVNSLYNPNHNMEIELSWGKYLIFVSKGMVASRLIWMLPVIYLTGILIIFFNNSIDNTIDNNVHNNSKIINFNFRSLILITYQRDVNSFIRFTFADD